MMILKVLALCLVAAHPAASSGADMVAHERVGGTLNPRMLVPQSEPDPSLPATSPTRTWLVPRWIMVGILARETRSFLIEDDLSVSYQDRRRSTVGARGPTQITKDTFEQFKRPGEKYLHVEKDMALALRMTERILVAHRAALGSWKRAIRAYVAGRGNWECAEAGRYYDDVVALGHEKHSK